MATQANNTAVISAWSRERTSKSCEQAWLAGERTESSFFGPLRHLQLAFVSIALLLPLIVLPGLQQPFSRPKLVLWVIVVLCGLARCGSGLSGAWKSLPATLQTALVLWLGALGASATWGVFASPESLFLALTGVGWLLVLMAVRPRPERLAGALVLSGVVVAAVAVAQSLRLDPFRMFGWLPDITTGPRMRVFATLGNPDFVAAFLCGLLPLIFAFRSHIRGGRWLRTTSIILLILAILATGSRAPIPGLVCALLWVIGLKRRKLWGALALAALCVSILAVTLSPARSLRTTLRGRAYIAKVSAPHLAEHWLLGLGPGGFGAVFPAWEAQYWKVPRDHRDRQFAGFEDHAENDYLEIVADTGLAGLLAFATVLFALLRQAWFGARAAGDHLIAGASAGMVALMAVALVDFPFMRPAESFLFWSLAAVSLVAQDTSRASHEPVRSHGQIANEGE